MGTGWAADKCKAARSGGRGGRGCGDMLWTSVPSRGSRNTHQWNCLPCAYQPIVNTSKFSQCMHKLFDMELPLLQVYVYDLNVNKYEPLCEQSGEFNNNCLSGI